MNVFPCQGSSGRWEWKSFSLSPGNWTAKSCQFKNDRVAQRFFKVAPFIYIFFTPAVSLTVEVARGTETRNEHCWHLPSGAKLIMEWSRPTSKIPGVHYLPMGTAHPCNKATHTLTIIQILRLFTIAHQIPEYCSVQHCPWDSVVIEFLCAINTASTSLAFCRLGMLSFLVCILMSNVGREYVRYLLCGTVIMKVHLQPHSLLQFLRAGLHILWAAHRTALIKKGED